MVTFGSVAYLETSAFKSSFGHCVRKNFFCWQCTLTKLQDVTPSDIILRKNMYEKGHQTMKKRWISLMLILVLVMASGCGKKNTQKKLKTEDLDETTLQGMAKDITKEMSLKNKIGQLFMVSVYQLDEAESKNQTSVTSNMKKALKKYPAGGIVMFAKNIHTREQTKKMIKDLQKASYVPLFMAVDEECGIVSRVASNKNMGMTAYPSAQEVGKTYSDKQIAQMGATQGKELKELGFNMNLAPVADVLTNHNNTEIGDRSFGTDCKKVANIVSILIKNMQKQQISATLKHFPGSGETGGDTHRGSTETYQTIENLRDNDFKPFRSGIKAGVDAVMVSHLMLSNVTDEKEPSSLSSRVVSDILRDELEYDGIIMTDAMNMKAITDNYDSGEAAIKAIKAGVDLIVMPDDYKKAYNAVYKAIKSGKIKESRIDKSVRRIIYAKLKRGEIQPDTTLLKDNQ